MPWGRGRLVDDADRFRVPMVTPMQEEQPSQSSARRTVEPDAAAAPSQDRRFLGLCKDAISSRLFLMTTLGALSGQIPALAAQGVLSSPSVVFTVGLTVVAGVGAFMAALDEARLDHARGRRVYTATALLSIVTNVAAAGVGLAVSQVVTLEHVRYFVALALALVAVEIASQRALTLPRGVPVPGVLVVGGVLLEALV